MKWGNDIGVYHRLQSDMGCIFGVKMQTWGVFNLIMVANWGIKMGL
jgi:hypothetical protein